MNTNTSMPKYTQILSSDQTSVILKLVTKLTKENPSFQENHQGTCDNSMNIQ